MSRYLVRWEIDIDNVQSPLEAAKRALNVQRDDDPDNSAVVFDVTDESGNVTRVDLSDYIMPDTGEGW